MLGSRITAVLSAVFMASTTVVLVTSPATGNDVCAGTGTATTGARLYYPGYPTPTSVSPTTATVGGPVTTTFSFTISLGGCVPGLTTLSGTGLVSGWCTLSSAEGITDDGVEFTWAGVGKTVIFTGGLVGIATFAPNYLSGLENCAHGAQNFIFTPVVAKMPCTTSVSTTTSTMVPTRQELTLDTHVTVQGGTLYTWVKVCAGV